MNIRRKIIFFTYSCVDFGEDEVEQPCRMLVRS